jgi:hypothetical protein
MANIGVTGHRILTDLDKISQGVELTISRIVKEFPGQSLRLLTQFAEGSDRLVAQHFRKLKNARITVVLPLSIDEYLKDFSRNSAKEFMELLRESNEIVNMRPLKDRDAAYEAAGLYILGHSDALICVWDGKVPQGRGGTGQIADLARRKKIPMAWIRAGNRKPRTLQPTSLGEDQGKVTFENF